MKTPILTHTTFQKLFNSLKARILFSFGFLFILTLVALKTVELYGLPFSDFIGNYKYKRYEAFRFINLIADLKKEQLLQWMEERRGDSAVIAGRIDVEKIKRLYKMIYEKRS
ncbi:MAG: hypothetical protein ACE5FU_10255, partial [Nitrospinota bacterium]